ncbi:MAG: DsbA family protein, partial [Candidatus Methylomirabilis sp.]|nr:DsbA family protein [Deltaproteobacteria bacterium]
MSEGRVRIAAFSDTICPYCYIGKRRIDQLAESFDFDIEWIPFEIHPETPAGGIPIEKLAIVRLAQLKHEVARIGEEVGL